MNKQNIEIEFSVTHVVNFSCGHQAVLAVIIQDLDSSPISRNIIPSGWSHIRHYECGMRSWIELESEEPFQEEELLKVQRKIQLLLDAFVAMTEGTAAEVCKLNLKS